MTAMRVPLVLMIAFVAYSAGCVRTTNVTLPRYERGAGEALSVAPTSSVYEARWSDDGRSFRTVRGSQRVVGVEQAIGFESGPDDQVIAVTAQERFELQHLPPRAKYLVWHTKVRDRTAVGRALAAPVNLASGVQSYFAKLQSAERRRPSSPRSHSTSDWASQWRQQEESARQAEKENKRERERIRRIFGLPPEKNRDCD